MPQIHIQVLRLEAIPEILAGLRNVVAEDGALEDALGRNGVLFSGLNEDDIAGFVSRPELADYPGVRPGDGNVRLLPVEGRIDTLFDLLDRLFVEATEPQNFLTIDGFRLDVSSLSDAQETRIRDGFSPETTRVTIEPGEPVTFTLSGVVSNRLTGEPLAGVDIDATFSSAGTRIFRTGARSDDNGVFRFVWENKILEEVRPGARIDVVFAASLDGQPLENEPVLRGLEAADQTFDLPVVVPQSFTLSGTVIDAGTGDAVPDVSIDFYFNKASGGRLLHTGTQADESGHFTTTFHNGIFVDLEPDARVDVAYRVHQFGNLLTSNSPLRGIEPEDTRFDIRVEGVELPPPPEDRSVVRGQVRTGGGAPLAGLAVAARARHVGFDTTLGETQTDAQGAYRIDVDKDRLDCSGLEVRVLGNDDRQLAVSDLLFRLEPEHVLDFVIGDGERVGLSEFARHHLAIRLCLANVPLADATDQHLEILQGATGVDRDHLYLLRLDAQWGRKHGIDGGVFYGLLRQDMPRDESRLHEEPRSAKSSALKASVEQHLIPLEIEQIPGALDQLEDVAVDDSFTIPTSDRRPPRGVVVATAGDVDARLQREFVRLSLQYDGDTDTDAFYAHVNEQPAFAGNAAAVDAIRFSVEAAPLLGDNVNALALVQQRRIQESWPSRSISDLARLDRPAWRGIFAHAGEADAEAVAETVAFGIEHRFPTQSVRHHVATDPAVGHDDLVRFFDANPAFDIRTTLVDDFLANGADLSGIGERELLPDRLKQIRRWYALTGPLADFPAAMHALGSLGLDNASEIAGKGPIVIGEMSPALGEDAAKKIYAVAETRSAVQQHIAVESIGYASPGISTSYIPGFTVPDAEKPDWVRMFGTLNGCACEHCSSVYSPAAYMVDILQFLHQAPVRGDKRPLEVLLDRRPDIEHILLECKNTNTLLPYIDLVNEVLEDAVERLTAGGTFEEPDVPREAPDPRAPTEDLSDYRERVARYQTTWEADRLRAEPEHERTEAYADLAGAPYPWNVAINPAMERAYFFLDYLGLDLLSLWETFEQQDSAPVIAYFRLTHWEWRIMTRKLDIAELPPGAAEARLAGLWGVDLSAGGSDDRSLIARLSSVSTFLDRSGLTFDDLKELVDARFLYRAKPDPETSRTMRLPSLRMAPLAGTDPCDIDNWRISRLDLDMLEVLHRFLRLRQKIGWSVKLFADMLSTFDLFWDREDFVADAGRFAMHLGRLAKELGRSVEDVLALYQQPEEQRRDAWARAFGLADFQFDRFVTLLDADPSDSPERARTMLAELDLIRATPFEIGELLYILQHEDESPPQFAPRVADLEDFLTGLRRFVDELATQHREGALPAIDQRVSDFAASPRSAEEIAAFRDVYVEDHPGSSEAEIEEAVEEFAASPRTEAEIAAFRAPLVEELDGAIDPLRITTIVESLAQLLGIDVDTVGALLQRQVDEASHEIISEAILNSIAEPDEPGITDFRNLMTVDVGEPSELPTTPEYGHARQLLIRVEKAARLIRGLKISAKQLRITHARRDANGFVDLNDLPVAEESSSAPLAKRTEAIIAVVEAKRLQEGLPSDELDLFDLIEEATLANPTGRNQPAVYFGLLEQHLGWLPEDVNALEDLHGGIEGFRNWRTFEKIWRAHVFSRRARVPMGNIASWLTYIWIREADELNKQADAIQRAARAKHHSNEAWYRTLTAFNDDLREKKRDALLAFLIHYVPFFAGAADVSGYFLIDPEMSSCHLTSRIKPANSTLQLFIQRCLMGLEKNEVEPDHNLPDPERPFWDRWIWMKNYRGWEANRKVFLYPENWIEPDLRDDKTPFFRELETELLQDEVTEATAEQAFITYLDKLEDVARLDVRGLYHEEDRDVLHVFARTRSEPYVYYYRHRRANRTWTPWQKLDLNIEGDHLIPVVHNRRLILFWAVFKEAGEYWDLNIFWSEYRQNRWGPRKGASSGALLRLQLGEHTPQEGRFRNKKLIAIDPEQFFFKVMDTQPLGIYLFSGEIVQVDATEDDIEAGVTYYPVGKSYSLAKFVFNECRSIISIDYEKKELLLTRDKPQPNDVQYYVDEGLFQEKEFEKAKLRVPIKVIGDDYLRSIDLRKIVFDGIISLDESLDIGRKIFLGMVSGMLDSDFIDMMEQFNRHYKLIHCQHEQHFLSNNPFVIDIDKHCLLVSPQLELFDVETSIVLPDILRGLTRYKFEFLHHPYVCDFILALRQLGIEGLLAPPSDHFLYRQFTPLRFGTYDPLEEYKPNKQRTIVPQELDIDFTMAGAYSIYNWELFFHIPLLIADRFSKDQRFEEAHRWFHYIFDPTDTSDDVPPAKYWQVKPFFQQALKPPETLSDLLRRIARGEETEQIRVWREDPFNPHAIARLRIAAYMKNVVMKYLDNLIAWGDDLVQQDTIESINGATQCFIIVSEILRDAPTSLPAEPDEPLSYAVVKPRRDGDRFINPFGNIWRDLEDSLPVDLEPRRSSTRGSASPPILHPYFCIPSNPKLQEYRETIADRLFKIRHCMNIEGQIRTLPLFEPPIDPALLVRARAAGLDLRTALRQITAVRLPHYRFAFCYQKALEFAGEVRAFGGALLAAQEKKDAEELALLRSRLEVVLLSSVRAVKQQQVDEARETKAALEVARKILGARREYYAGKTYRNSREISQISKIRESRFLQKEGGKTEVAAQSAYALGDLHLGIVAGLGGGGVELYKIPFGSVIGHGLGAWARYQGSEASVQQSSASIAGLLGSFDQRWDDWQFQVEQTKTELDQTEKQIAAAEIRLAIAEKDLENHEKQIDQSRQVQDYLHSKFTNLELQNWRCGQLSALHYQAYQMAYGLALGAEQAAQRELGLKLGEFSYINAGHWEGGRKGLLAAERLEQDIRRMEIAYMEANRRDYEVASHVSLASLDPAQLIRLRETGVCEIRIPEIYWDIDFPSHICRRIKSISVTIPCVTGPFTGVKGTLRLISSKIRYEPLTNDGESVPELITEFGGREAIALSSAQNDSGLFERNFRDERNLPFEGAGAISYWRLELSPMSAFDHRTIADVILHAHINAKEGGETHKGLVSADLEARWSQGLADWEDDPAPLAKPFSLRHEFAGDWHTFLFPAPDAHINGTAIEITERQFPYILHRIVKERQFELTVEVILRPSEQFRNRAPEESPFAGLRVEFGPDGETLHEGTLRTDELRWGGLLSTSFPSRGSGSPPTGLAWTTPLNRWHVRLRAEAGADELPGSISIVENGHRRLDPAAVDDIYLLFGLKWQAPAESP